LNGIWVDSTGSIFAADEQNYRIRKIDPNGIISTFGGSGTSGTISSSRPLSSAVFYRPYSIVGDFGTLLYISDNYYVWKYLYSTGIVSIFAGTSSSQGYSGDAGPANNALLNYPKGLWLTTSGVLYIADSGNRRIRKVSSEIITTVAGSTNGGGYSGDNGLAWEAALNYPTSVYLDTLNKMFIGDTNNGRIRMVDTNNIITTFAGTDNSYPYNGDNIPATLANLNEPYDVKGDTLGTN
jgi:hypothetical protein